MTRSICPRRGTRGGTLCDIMADVLRFNPRSVALINEGDRVKTDTVQTGRVDMIGGFGAVAYVQLEEYTRDVYLTLFQADALTIIRDSGSAPRSTAT